MSKYIDNISKQTAAGFGDDEFYLVMEKVDFLMQLWAGEQMGDDVSEFRCNSTHTEKLETNNSVTERYYFGFNSDRNTHEFKFRK